MKKEEAIEVVKKNWPDSRYTCLREALETLIPELAESEDEKARKWIYEYIHNCPNESFEFYGGVGKQAVLAYLEKQKDIEDRWIEDREQCFWNGVEEGKMLAEKRKEHHLELKAGKWYICHRAFCARADHLTVKEGERFQCEKDGIVKGFVIKEPEKYFKECSTPEPMQKEQKPAEWSEDFEQNIRNLLHDKLTWHSDDGSMSSAVFIDDKTIKDIVTGIWFYVGKEMMKNPNMELPKQEWSEEDEDFINMLILHFNYLIDKGGDSVETYKSYIEKLKSLRPQPQWKPSEEQMEALEDAFRKDGSDEYRKTINSLYQDLKKLM